MIRQPTWSGKKAPTAAEKAEEEAEAKKPGATKKKSTSTDDLRKKLRDIRMKNDLMKKGKK